MSGSIARRYAKAIAEIARDEGSLEQTGADLQNLAAIAADAGVASQLANPLLSAPTRRAIARAIADQLGLRPTTRNFLCLLADHQRLDHLIGIAANYERLVDRALGRVRARVTSIAPLTPEQEGELVASLARLTGKTVLVEHQIDPDLLGGLLVEVEGKVYDGSVRTQLQLLAGRIAGQRSVL